MMDLGATICRPKPACRRARSPKIVSPDKAARRNASAKARRLRPHRRRRLVDRAEWRNLAGAAAGQGHARGNGCLPGPEWSEKPPAVRPLAHVSHGFTHFTLDLHIVVRADPPAKAGGSRSISSPKRGCRRSIARRSRPCSISGVPLPPDPFFSGAGFDRADHLRADPAAIAELYGDDEARQLVWQDGAPAVDEQGKLRWKPVEGSPPLFLGFNHGSPRFSALPDGDPTTTAYAHFQLLGSLDARRGPDVRGRTEPGELAPAPWALLVVRRSDRSQPRRLVADVRLVRVRALSAESIRS